LASEHDVPIANGTIFVAMPDLGWNLILSDSEVGSVHKLLWECNGGNGMA
jgi:hypothetical protein